MAIKLLVLKPARHPPMWCHHRSSRLPSCRSPFCCRTICQIILIKLLNSRVLAPSSLLFYLGIDFKVPGIKHHNLFLMKILGRMPKFIPPTCLAQKALFYLCALRSPMPPLRHRGKIFLYWYPFLPNLVATMKTVRANTFKLCSTDSKQ